MPELTQKEIFRNALVRLLKETPYLREVLGASASGQESVLGQFIKMGDALCAAARNWPYKLLLPVEVARWEDYQRKGSMLQIKCLIRMGMPRESILAAVKTYVACHGTRFNIDEFRIYSRDQLEDSVLGPVLGHAVANFLVNPVSEPDLGDFMMGDDAPDRQVQFAHAYLTAAQPIQEGLQWPMPLPTEKLEYLPHPISILNTLATHGIFDP